MHPMSNHYLPQDEQMREIAIIKYKVQKNKRYFSFIFHYRKPHNNRYKDLTRSDKTHWKTILQDNFSTHDTTHMTTKNERQKIKIPGHSPKLGTIQGSAVTHDARVIMKIPNFITYHQTSTKGASRRRKTNKSPPTWNLQQSLYA